MRRLRHQPRPISLGLVMIRRVVLPRSLFLSSHPCRKLKGSPFVSVGIGRKILLPRRRRRLAAARGGGEVAEMLPQLLPVGRRPSPLRLMYTHIDTAVTNWMMKVNLMVIAMNLTSW